MHNLYLKDKAAENAAQHILNSIVCANSQDIPEEGPVSEDWAKDQIVKFVADLIEVSGSIALDQVCKLRLHITQTCFSASYSAVIERKALSTSFF